MLNFNEHPVYKKAKFKYYLSRWFWVIWNAFISIALFASARFQDQFIGLTFVLFCLTFLCTLFLLIVMPKTKFEDSSECENVKDEIRKLKNS